MFIKTLFTKTDDAQIVLKKLQDLATDEERMAIAELVTDVHSLKLGIQDGMLYHALPRSSSLKL